MDDLLSEFLMESSESLDVVDAELVRFEQEPNNSEILGNIFRLVHTIKGTCGFLGLPRLEAIAHAAETLMGQFRDGVPVTGEAVTLILKSLDRIKALLAELEALDGVEPEGDDRDLIAQLEVMAGFGDGADTKEAASAPAQVEPPEDMTQDAEPPVAVPALERELKPGEVSLEELERAFQEAEGPEDVGAPPAQGLSDLTQDGAGAGSAPTPTPDTSTASSAAAPTAQAAEPKSENPAAKPPAKKPASVNDDRQRKAGGPSVSQQSIRVNVDTLENLMTMVSELVLTRNQLMEISRKQEDGAFKVPLQRLSNVTAELQEGVMQTRMQPIGNAWQKLPRIVRDLAQELDKQIELEMHGQETELDRQVLELIKDPLTHMVRNSADHGLETQEGRAEAGKPAKGTIRLSAYHEGGHIIIEITDDGKGIDTDKVKRKAFDNGLISEAELDKMTEQQAAKLIFHAGLSTATKVTNVSGRGVGMDVVRNNIEMIGGTVDVKSEWGKGSTFSIKIPLTLAIVSALIVQSAHQRYAIPQLAVLELVHVLENSEHQIERIRETPVLRLRNKLLPLVHLDALLGLEKHDADETIAAASDNGFIVVMQVGPQTFGVVVDAVFHTEEIVVKPMASMLRDIAMFSGNTILGDGSVIMIVDPNGIAQALGNEVGVDDVAADTETHDIDQRHDQPVSMLLFRAGGDQVKAVPLSLITRLEEFDRSKIETSNDRLMVQYRGSLMPLVTINETASLVEQGPQPMLVFTDDNRSMGLVVDEIVDIVNAALDIQIGSDRAGILGSSIIQGHATEVIDIAHYLPQAFGDWLQRKDLDKQEKSRRVLFVDDSAFFRNMLVPVIKAAGYEVRTCDGAVAARRLVDAGAQFDAIISDIEMPEMDGYEFARYLRGQAHLRQLPVIALSSLTASDAVEKARSAGFDDYVAKFDREGLLDSLGEMMALHSGKSEPQTTKVAA